MLLYNLTKYSIYSCLSLTEYSLHVAKHDYIYTCYIHTYMIVYIHVSKY